MASDADEVAEDYRHALEDLSSNMRFEISNLTVIARENTEHALAIAEVLQQHILKAPPNKKLPALYVLDSIVKNVGTPYTLYFGRNLFKTFMESYAVVDHNIRRKMEEMLKTWKDPVPGSLDTRPVFSHELVRPIENALMKAKAVTMAQQGSVPGRPRAVLIPHRNTPTPPGTRGPGGPTGPLPPQTFTHPNGGRIGEPATGPFSYLGQQQYSNSSAPQPVISATASISSAFPGPFGSAIASASTGISVETLSSDIQNLIAAMKAEFSQSPHDTSVQNRLRALLELQGVVQRANLPPDQLELIKNKVTELAAVTMRTPSVQSSSLHPALVPTPNISVPPLTSTSVTPAPATLSASSSQASLTLDSLFGPGTLATLMARQSATPQSLAASPLDPTTSGRLPLANDPKQAKQVTQGPLALLDKLRLAGMIPSAQRSGLGEMASQQLLGPGITNLLASAKGQRGQRGLSGMDDIGFDTASLKQECRPGAISALYDDLGLPCTQCGRRFKTDEEGKRRKTAHMDWHFHVHQRSTEAEKRGTYRSWYVDGQEWLRCRETVDTDQIGGYDENSTVALEPERGPEFVPVPDAGSGINTVCPICQERFENKWLDTAQEWVWLDTVLVGGRAYHASCHVEATRDREGTPRRTPERVLGKRKAETRDLSPETGMLKLSG